MARLSFFDMKTKSKFETDDFKLETRKGRMFAVATSPSGTKAFRIVSKSFRR